MATDNNKVVNLKFKWQNDTKGAIRFGEVLPSGEVATAPNDPGAHIGTLYFRKTAFPDGHYPKEVALSYTF